MLFLGARIVKAFNSIGMGNIDKLNFNGISADAFICRDDPSAKQVVSKLAAELGFSVVDVGDLTMARYLEPLAMLWIRLAYKQGFGSQIAFKLLRR